MRSPDRPDASDPLFQNRITPDQNRFRGRATEQSGNCDRGDILKGDDINTSPEKIGVGHSDMADGDRRIGLVQLLTEFVLLFLQIDPQQARQQFDKERHPDNTKTIGHP